MRLLNVLLTLILTLFLTLALSSQALAQSEVFEGFVTHSPGKILLKELGTNHIFSVKTQDIKDYQVLLKLGDSDYISGQGRADRTNMILNLESVTSVGLRALLGSWGSDDTAVNFIDFTNVDIYSTSSIGTALLEGILPPNATASSFQYTLTPTDSGDWKVFFSNPTTVVMANLIITDQAIDLEIIDSQTGNIFKTLHLNRMKR